MKHAYEVKVSEKEKKLLELIKTMKFGHMNIKIQNSKPTKVEKCIISIKL